MRTINIVNQEKQAMKHVTIIAPESLDEEIRKMLCDGNVIAFDKIVALVVPDGFQVIEGDERYPKLSVEELPKDFTTYDSLQEWHDDKT